MVTRGPTAASELAPEAMRRSLVRRRNRYRAHRMQPRYRAPRVTGRVSGCADRRAQHQHDLPRPDIRRLAGHRSRVVGGRARAESCAPGAGRVAPRRCDGVSHAQPPRPCCQLAFPAPRPVPRRGCRVFPPRRRLGAPRLGCTPRRPNQACRAAGHRRARRANVHARHWFLSSAPIRCAPTSSPVIPLEPRSTSFAESFSSAMP